MSDAFSPCVGAAAFEFGDARMSLEPSTIHASAVLVGARALLIQGPPAAGKSRLALALLDAAEAGLLAFARLVADDRVVIEASHGRLLARPAPVLAGLIEVRGLGIRRVPYEPVAVVGALVELAAQDASRLPEPERREATLAGIRLPRLAVAAGAEPLALALAYLRTADAIP
jgi:serine kinase of HPr protein (carbohydrate metabolism regulator)